MGAGVTLWVRPGEAASDGARAFLKAHGYAADAVRDLRAQPPGAADLAAAARALGGDPWALVDVRHPSYGEVLPRGGEGLGPDGLVALLASHPQLLKAPVLLTPKGGVAGFRETAWRAFLDVGKGRA